VQNSTPTPNRGVDPPSGNAAARTVLPDVPALQIARRIRRRSCWRASSGAHWLRLLSVVVERSPETTGSDLVLVEHEVARGYE
jgi:hypothetical protein